MYQGVLGSRISGTAAPDHLYGEELLVAGDAQCADSLALVMRHFRSALGADAMVLVLHPLGEEDPAILYCDASVAVRQAVMDGWLVADRASEFMFHHETETEARFGRLVADAVEWTTIRIPLHLGDGRRFTILAAFCAYGAEAALPGNALIASLHPFLVGCLSIWSARFLLRDRIGSFASALNHSSIGVILLDSARELMFANPAAEALIAGGDPIRRSGRSIVARNLVDAVRLHVAIEHVMSDRAGGSATPVLALRRGGRARPLMVSFAAASASAGCSGAILYLLDPDHDVEPLLAPACQIYGLSPVEGRLTCLLVGGACLADAAAAMRVKEQTARAYLKQIFIKTEVNRQADLVRLMLSSVVPTASRDISSLI